MKMYILVDHIPVRTNNFKEWNDYFDFTDRVVKKEKIATGIEVSTVFLGIDHRFGKGTPLVFETMIFSYNPKDDLDGYKTRCSTWEEAEEMHKVACKLVTERLKIEK